MLSLFTILYLVLTVLAGIVSSSRVKEAEDFALAGRRLPFHLSLTAFFATWFGAETILGASSRFAELGFAGIIEDPFGASLCLILTGLVFVRCFYSKGYLSIGDFFKERYGKTAEFITSLLQALSYFTYSSAQFVALGIVLETVTGFSFSSCLVAGTLLVVSYTYFGGMWALALTDFLQSIVIVTGLAVLTVFLSRELPPEASLTGMLGKYNSFLPENSFNGWASFFSAWIIMGFGSIPSQDIFQRIMSARSEKVAKWSALLSGVLYFLIAMLPLAIVTMSIKIYNGYIPGDSQQIIPQMVLRHMPLPVQVLFFGALLSAILSTACASLLAQATVIGENLIKPFCNSLTSREFLRLLRLLVLGVSAVSLFISFNISDIFFLSSLSSSLVLVTLFVPLTGGLLFPGANSWHAFISILCGAASYSICLYFNLGILSVFWGFFASLAGFFTGFLLPVHKKSEKPEHIKELL